jgi:hypothetical protein
MEPEGFCFSFLKAAFGALSDGLDIPNDLAICSTNLSKGLHLRVLNASVSTEIRELERPVLQLQSHLPA